MSSKLKKLIIGIDIGTTSVKVSVLDTISSTILATNCETYHFDDYNNKLESNYKQQSVKTLFNSVENCIIGLSSSICFKDVAVISICGQMHGCVLWNDSAYSYREKTQTFQINDLSVSDLYTWQDSRCTPQFIQTLPKPDSYVDSISSGFGCATIFWLQKYSPHLIDSFSCSGTIMDFMVTALCDSKYSIMSDQNATSWGYFDPINNLWNEQILKSNGFPTHLLPKVVNAGTVAGLTAFNWVGIEANTRVMVAFGDLQCTCFASLRNNDSAAVLNIGTSMQLSLLMPNDYIPSKKSESINAAIDYFPYFGNQYLAVAASLNGGNVLHSLVSILKNITEQLANVSVSEEKIWEKLLELSSFRNDSNLRIITTLFGERHNTHLRASISNITDSIETGHIMKATCEGLIDNIFEMMPIQFIINNRVKTLIGTGSALLRNPVLKHILQTKLNIPVVYIDCNDADVGACYVANAYTEKLKTLIDN